jgi:prophage maintenance system killer protein
VTLHLHIDIQWLLDRQERVLAKDLQVRDYSSLIAAVARHRVNTPHLDEDNPDAYWRAAALLDTLVLQRPLPVRNEFYAYAVTVAYLTASGENVTAHQDQWIQLIEDIQALRLDSFAVADRLRSWRAP